MKIFIDGGIGDELAMTAALREFKRQHPDEMVVLRSRQKDIVFGGNPNAIPTGIFEDGEVWTSVHLNEDIGNNSHSYAAQLGLKRMVDDTPEIYLSEGEIEFGRKVMAGIQSPVLTVDTRATWPSRAYPFEKYDSAASFLKTLGWSIVEVGSSSPRDDVRNLERRRLSAASLSMVDKTTVREAASVIKASQCFLGNDSGLFHMAAAVGVPQVAVFGVKWWFNRAYWNTVPVFRLKRCNPSCDIRCEEKEGVRCFDDISSDHVVEAVELARKRFSIR